jgi:hypothetical protein
LKTLFKGSALTVCAVQCALLAAVPIDSAWACATCGCTLSTDAAMGYSTSTGWRFNIQYDYINQDELRTGTRTATAEQVVNQPSDPALGGGEIENGTLNRYFTLGLSYSPNHDWQLELRVPYVQRDHSSFGVQLQPFDPSQIAPDQLSSARVSGLGDMRAVASYQGLLATHNLGLQLGLKLPTGNYGTQVVFNSGPLAGEPLDASLQAGTGSTDVIVGAYYYAAISQDFDVIANGEFQAAIAHRLDQPGNDFRPGNSVTGSVGLRYEANPKWVPQLQLNLLRKSADQGDLADRANTAGSVAYLSPGLTAQLTQGLYVYGFVQIPVVSNLDGYQLFPRWTVSAGMSYAL